MNSFVSVGWDTHHQGSTLELKNKPQIESYWPAPDAAPSLIVYSDIDYDSGHNDYSHNLNSTVLYKGYLSPPNVSTMKFTASPTSPTFDIPSSPLAGLIPTFLRRPTPSNRPSFSRSRASSFARAPSPDLRTPPSSTDLLDDDPFACQLKGPSPGSSEASTPALLSPTQTTFQFDSPPPTPSTPTRKPPSEDGSQSDSDIQPLHRRGRSLTTISVHPRNQTWQSDRPAFRPRPSLPSLYTLAQQNVIVRAPKSSRAKLFPIDPWENTGPVHPVATPPEVSRAEPETYHAALSPHPSPIEEEEEEEITDSITGTVESIPDSDEPTPDVDVSETIAALEEFSFDTPSVTVDHAPDLFTDIERDAGCYRTSGLAFGAPSSPAPSSCLLPSPRSTSPVYPTSSSAEDESDSDAETDVGCQTEGTQSEVYPWSVAGDSEAPTCPPSPTLTRGRPLYKINTIRPFSRRMHQSPDDKPHESIISLFSPEWSKKRAASHPPDHLSQYSALMPRNGVISCSAYESRGTSYGGQYGGQHGRDRQSEERRPNGDGDQGDSRRDQGSSGGHGAGRGGRDDDDHSRRPRRASASQEAPSGSDDEDSGSDYGDPEPVTESEDRRSLELEMARRSAGRQASNAPPVPRLPEQYKTASPDPSRGMVPPSVPQSRAPSWAAAPPPRPRTQSVTAPGPTSYRPRLPSAPVPNVGSSSFSPHSSNSSSDSDDVPLAQRIPTALTAQKSIRQKVRDDKTRRGPSNPERRGPKPAVGLGLGVPAPQTRTSRTSGGVAPDELMMKLLRVQQQQPEDVQHVGGKPTQSLSRNQSQSGTHAMPSPRASRHPEMQHPTSPGTVHMMGQMQAFQMQPTSSSSQPVQDAARTIRPSRSLHRLHSQAQPAMDSAPLRRDRSLGPRNEKLPPLDVHAHPLPISKSRHASPDTRDYLPKAPLSPTLAKSQFASSRPSGELAPPRTLGSRQPSFERSPGATPRLRQHTMDEHSAASHPRTDDLRRAKSSRDPTRGDAERSTSRPPVPAIPTPSQQVGQSKSRVPSHGVASPPPRDTATQQQRVFISDLQSFRLVEIGASTRAGDVLEMVAAQGELEGSGWMLWELANEFGMERPLRDFELLSDVFSSWNSEARLNALMLRQTPFAPLLSRRGMPTSSPTFGAYVNWEAKRGKWSKRWLELREHSLFLSKKEGSKDETVLCTLSAFDAYLYRRMPKAPKSFVFAVKSTDSITLFENPSDCVHVFSCDPELGNTLVEKILVARSYVLQQERNVLFRSQPVHPVTNSKSLSRSGTRTGAPSRPLVGGVTPTLPPLSFQPTAPPGAGLFSEGSLLGKPSTVI